MDYHTDIFKTSYQLIESQVGQMPDATYSLIVRALYILCLALLLCKLCFRGHNTIHALQWGSVIASFVAGCKAPIYLPDSLTAKTVIVILGFMAIIFAPPAVSAYLSRRPKWQKRIMIVLYAMLIIALVLNRFVRSA